jgi:hypothetical protein
MVLPQPPQSHEVTLITPECEAPGCSVSGDQYTMIRCRKCSAWFCSEHIDADAGVTLVRPAPRILTLAYYEGICSVCKQERQQTHH